MLRRPHDHHRELRARLLPAHASDQLNQDRHLMSITASARTIVPLSPISLRPQQRSFRLPVATINLINLARSTKPHSTAPIFSTTSAASNRPSARIAVTPL